MSILNNTARYEQMFLCTQSLDYKLLDAYYVGKALIWDGSSHDINYKIINYTTITFNHVDYGSIIVNGEHTTDT